MAAPQRTTSHRAPTPGADATVRPPCEGRLRRGVFPGSFNPPTAAHLAISEAALAQHRLDVIVWSVSRVALAKEHVQRPLLSDRIAVLERVAAPLDWLAVDVTDAQLLADIAAGFDVIVMGADKWQQIHDPVFYGDDPARRDASIAALPTVAVATRPPFDCPADLALDVPAWAAEMSSTRARSTDPAFMAPVAALFDAQTGAWTDPRRYEAWLAGRPRDSQGD